jgi:GLPGLI family protein
MKKISFILILIFSVFTGISVCNAQNNTTTTYTFTPKTDDGTKDVTLGPVKFIISYDESFVKDTTQLPYKYIKEPMLLEISDSVSHFYSYKMQQSDSIMDAGNKTGHYTFYRSYQVPDEIYKNYPKNGFYIVIDRMVVFSPFHVEGKMETPQWQFISDSTATILGYQCHLAVTKFKGRTWKAWYADDIPLDNGPWKLCGLPGLILRAYDSQRQFVFNATGMEQKHNDKYIVFRNHEAETISQKNLLDIYKRYNADPVGYLSNDPSMKVVSKDDNGNVINKMSFKYNYIER